MQRWTLVLTALILAGCSAADDGASSSVGALSLFDPVAANPSLCGGPAIPYPNNALFSGTTDATLNIPNAASVPFVTAANLTDGFSTSASIFTDVLGAVDFNTANDAVLIFEADASPRFLVAGVDFTVQPSIAMAQVSGTGPAAGACASTGFPARFRPISQQRSRLLIEPLKPLNPSTTYIVAVTRGLKSKDGLPTLPNEFWKLVNSDAKICDLTGVEAGPELDCTDPAAPAAAAAALNAPVLTTLSAPPTTANAKLTTLETLRRKLIRPTVTGLKNGYMALKGAALNDSDLVIAWSFTTQSTGLTLSRLNTSTSSMFVANTGITTGALGVGLADTANIYAGTLAVPYYLANASGGGGAAATLSTFWTSTGTLNAVNPPALGGAVPCSALAPSVSTTICHPDPTVISTETIPVMVTVPNNHVCDAAPNAAPLCSGGVVQKPANGWPVAIFQHGITRSRTDMLALAPTLASAGFVTIALDIPLHGVTNNSANLATNPFYRNQIFSNPAFGGVYNSLITGERTFDLDLANNTTGAPGADTVIDSSGTYFINLSSLITSRDNLRQAEADVIHLARSMAALDLDGNPNTLVTTDIDETKISFVGQSLGAIVGTTVLGNVNSTLINVGVLNVPGGGLAKLLDASAAFGPRISAGLAASFVFQGTDTYETFLRFAQHLTDPGDPINYAAAANAGHNLLVTEVIGDSVVPNSAGSTCPAAAALPLGLGATATTVDAAGTAGAAGAAGVALLALCPPLVIPASAPLSAITYQDKTVITGFLSGTDALVRMMGLTSTVQMGSVPFVQRASAGADTVVEFAPNTAEHGTLLSPNASSNATQPNTTFAQATCAEQKQTATFLATLGTVVPVGGACP